MKKICICLIASLVSLAALAFVVGDANGDGNVDVADITAVAGYILSGDAQGLDLQASDANKDGNIDVADITAIAGIILSGGEDEDVADNTVLVKYNGETAKVSVAKNIANYLSVDVNGADVSITADGSLSNEINYILSGSATDGMFQMNGSYKCTLTLNDVSITNADGAAVEVNCGKRIAVVVADGTENSLVDGSGAQKACFFVKGHAEFEGSGVLNITGNNGHAYRSNEYSQLKKKFTGEFNVLGAASDGIHVKQYFQMNNGNVTIKNVQGDGIQAEVTGDDDEDDGQVIIKGGVIDITTSGMAAKGIKSDSLITITDGDITITQTGEKEMDEEGDLSYVTAIKSGSDIDITGGKITIHNTADGGKGISADGNIHIAEANVEITANGTGDSYTKPTPDEPQASYRLYVNIPETSGGGGGGAPGGGGGGQAWTSVYLYNSSNQLVATLTNTVTATSTSGLSKTFYYYDFGEATSGTYYFKSDNYQSMGSRSTYTIKSGTITLNLTGTDVFYMISSSYSTSGTTRTYSISNVTSTYGNGVTAEANTYSAMCIKSDGNTTIDSGTLTFTHSGAMSKGVKCDGTMTINGGTLGFTTSGTSKAYGTDAVYCTAIKADNYVQTGGEITVKATGLASRGISVDEDMTITGGANNITCSGAGALLGSNDSYAAKGYTVNGNLVIEGGSHTITCTGKGGKGINVDRTATFGGSEVVKGSAGDGPMIKITTSGAVVGGSGENLIGSAKAIKVQGAITMNSGEMTLKTSTNGAEGIESKSFISFNGGLFSAQCYDDCINSKGNLNFNGTYVFAYSNGNDAIDSNSNSTGGITINDGIVFCYSTKGSPEEGMDIDNMSLLVVNGGYLMAAGGRQSSVSSLSSSSTQGYGIISSSISFSNSYYYSVLNSSGTNMFTVKFPNTVSSQLCLVTAQGMTKGQTYYIKRGTAAPTNPSATFSTYAWLGGTSDATTQISSFSAK